MNEVDVIWYAIVFYSKIRECIGYDYTTRTYDFLVASRRTCSKLTLIDRHGWLR